MTKALNQHLYSDIVYGGEAPSGSLRLEATSDALKGSVEIVGALLDLVIGGQIGRFQHANTGTRLYTLPDQDGTLLTSGLMSDAYDMIYASEPNVWAALHMVANAVLCSGTDGPVWRTGLDGQFLQMQGGTPTWGALPSTVGSIEASPAAWNLPRYGGSTFPSNDLVYFTTVAERALLANASAQLTWALITAKYLAGSTGALANGTAGQRLAAVGDGSFAWVDDPSVVNPGVQYAIPYYSASGTVLAGSDFLQVSETARALNITSGTLPGVVGRLRLYEDVGAHPSTHYYVSLRAPASLPTNVSLVLPSEIGLPDTFLKIGSVVGNEAYLTFQEFDPGSVVPGLQNQLAWYAAAGHDVSGLATIATRVLMSPGGVPTWDRITAPYLSKAGGGALDNGVNQAVLISNGGGSFSWIDARNLTGEVKLGQAGYLPYYPAAGTAVQGSAFLWDDETGRRVELRDGGALEFRQPTGLGSNGVSFVANATTEAVAFTLPPRDGTNGQALLTDGSGRLSFQTVGRGTVQDGSADTLARYGAASNVVASFAKPSDARALVTNLAGSLAWELLTDRFLSDPDGLPLANASANQVLVADGADANGVSRFSWTDAQALVGQINPGTASYLAYYRVGGSGTEVDSTSFVRTDETAKALEIVPNGSVRLYGATHYVGLKAPSGLTQDLPFTLPASNGAATFGLMTDGAGNTYWADPGYGTVENGTVGALPVYSTADHVVASSLLVPNALPVTPYEALVANLDGQLEFRQLVQSGVANGMAYYSAEQSVASSPDVTVLAGALVLNHQTALEFCDNASSGFVGIAAPSVVPNSYTLALPAEAPLPGQILAANTASELAWVLAGSDRSLEQHGSVEVTPNTSTLSIVFAEPFADTPQHVGAAWSIQDAGVDIAMLPTLAVRAVTREALVLSLSDTVEAGSYRVYWSAKRFADTALPLAAYLLGGQDGATLLGSYWSMLLDVDTGTLTSGALSTARGYAAGGSSGTHGYALGGQTPTSDDGIVKLQYATGSVTETTGVMSGGRDSAAGIGTRTCAYAAGGKSGAAPLSSFDKLTFATETAALLPALLADQAVGRGACGSGTTGYVVLSDVLGTLQALTYATETTAIATPLGSETYRVGCNAPALDIGLLGADDGTLRQVQLSTGTVSVVSSALTNTTGLSASWNSLLNGYFSGQETVEAVDFMTLTVSTVNALSVTTMQPGSVATFQSGGLI